MVKIKTIIVLVLATGLMSAACGQDFINLDFESATDLPPYSGNLVATSNALPGWVASSGSQIVYFNSDESSIAAVALLGTNAHAIDGNYSVQLDRGGAISQTALVPATAETLFFEARNVFGFSMTISLDGQDLSFTNISNAPGYSVYAADVSAFAGQKATLSFSTGETPVDEWIIDDIQFSPSPVPEPGTFALINFGATLFGFHRWRRLKSLL